LRSLEDEVNELQEAGKRRINVSHAEVEKGTAEIAADNKLGVPQILKHDRAGRRYRPRHFASRSARKSRGQKLVAARYGPDIQSHRSSSLTRP